MSDRIAMRIRVLTYNVHKCVGPVDRRYRPERISDTIKYYHPDLVLLQEIGNGATRGSAIGQCDVLGELLDMNQRTFFPNVALRRGGAYGNAILSRFPLTETRNIDLTIPPKKRRSVLHARYRIRADGASRSRTLHVFNLHLGLSGMERKIQLLRFLDGHAFAGLHPETPIVVGGDFNDLYGTLGPKLLAPRGFRTARQVTPTFPAWAPVRALDGLYVRGPVIIRHFFRSRLALARRASDHLPLIADLEITGACAADDA